MLITMVTTINWFILCYLILLSAGYLVLMFIALPDILLRYRESEVLDHTSLMQLNIMPHMTVIVPAYNEEANILETIYSILRSDYTNVNIIVVSPGSTDKTLEKLITEFDLIPVHSLMEEPLKTYGKVRNYYVSRFLLNFTVIDQERTDRSDTLNVGINACRTALCMTLDADTLLEPTAITKAVFFMLTQPNMVSVGGCVYILNGSTFDEGKITKQKMPFKPLYGFQACEYIRSFLFFRAGWNSFGAMSYAGAFTCFQRDLIISLGGYENENLAQDFEIITHIQAHKYENNIPYNIGFTPAAIAFTDVPGTLKEYWQQRFNWQYWMLHTLGNYKKMLFNPKYGSVGMITYPFFLFGEVYGALVEFSAYIMVFLSWYLGILDVYWVVLLLIVCWGFVMFLTIATALINYMTFKEYKRYSDLFLMLLYIVIENFGFRQFNVLCRVYATFCYYTDVFKSRRKEVKDTRLEKDHSHD